MEKETKNIEEIEEVQGGQRQRVANSANGEALTADADMQVSSADTIIAAIKS